MTPKDRRNTFLSGQILLDNFRWWSCKLESTPQPYLKTTQVLQAGIHQHHYNANSKGLLDLLGHRSYIRVYEFSSAFFIF